MALLILTFGVLLQRFSFPLTFCIDSTVAKLFSIRKQLAWYYKDITYVAKGYACYYCTWHTLREPRKNRNNLLGKWDLQQQKKSESYWQADESIPQRQYLHNLQLNIDILFYIFINLIAFSSHSLFVCISRTDLSSMKCASSFPEFSHFINYLKYAYNICSTSTSLMDVPGENE